MIKAIETKYNGCNFRSRLEARWAVFFDAAGIEYQYEPEGFDLRNGVWYLPDFWLPQVKMWAEVKPITLTPDEIMKCEKLHEGTGHPVLFLIGPPDYKVYFSTEKWEDDMGRYDYWLCNLKQYWITESRFYCNYGFLPGDTNFIDPVPLGEDFGEHNNEWIEKARSARFER